MNTLLALIQTKVNYAMIIAVNYVVKEAIIIIKVKTTLLLFPSNRPFASV